MSVAAIGAGGERRRDDGIDAVRYLLCFAVIVLHSLPDPTSLTAPPWVVAAATGCRAAVPFFFIASGFFLRYPGRPTLATVARPLRRLLPVYLVWALVYTAFFSVYSGEWITDPKTIVGGGGGFHLWFLPALGVSLAAVPLAISIVGWRATTALCALLAALGLMFGSYHAALGLPEMPAQRFTAAPLLVLLGGWLARTERPRSFGVAFGVALAAWAGVIGEEALIAYAAHGAIVSHAIVAMTFVLGVAIFRAARALPASAIVARLAALGRISLGVYAAHWLLLGPLTAWTGNANPLIALADSIAALILATLLSYGLNRVPMLRGLVR